MDGPVNALAVDGQGNLYAGGNFIHAGGASANQIARWDGTTWHSLGTGMSGGHHYYKGVDSLVLDAQGHLFAGGDFTIAGGVSANDIARWDGTAWHSLGTGMSGGSEYFPTVYTLMLDGQGDLFAGGDFTKAGGRVANNISRWHNNNPSAENDNFSIHEGSTLTVEAPGVLSNDIYSNGFPISAAVEESPSSGSLELNPNGSFKYIPESNYAGMVSFVYKASDDYGGTDISKVMIHVYRFEFFLPINLKK